MATTSVLAKLAVNISANNAEFNKKLSQTQNSISSFQKTIGNVAKVAGGLFAVDKLLEFGRGVFNVTAEFQKFEAVLTNTLGNNSAAKAAMSQITEFAAKTPFQVDELTGSFVKLANQGFVPTLDQMRSLGDLAAAMGKSFDQLTEAIIDAQTGEFERLKEFGIRAQKQGDKVTFTFKGVKKQVDFTADSIREYILSLGQAEGVSGGMEAISKTLGGTLSNVGDAIDQVKLALGKLIEGDGLVSTFLNNFAEGAKKIAEVLGGPTKEELEKTRDLLAQIREKAWAEKDMATWDRARAAWQAADERLRAMAEGQEELAKVQETKTIPAVKAQVQSVRELVDEWDRLNHKTTSSSTSGKTGADFMFDSGAMAEMANAGSGPLAKLSEGLQVNSNAWAIWAAGVNAHLQIVADKVETDFTPLIQNALSGIGEALGDAVTGAGNLGDSLLKVLGGVLTQLGQMILTAGIGIEAFKKSLASLNGVAAIAAGIALIALGSVVSKGISGLGSGAGGGGGAPGRTPSEMNMKVGGRIRGYDLAIVSDKESYRRGRLG